MIENQMSPQALMGRRICQESALNHGLPAEVGSAVFSGLLTAIDTGWGETELMFFISTLKDKFSTNDEALSPFWARCNSWFTWLVQEETSEMVFRCALAAETEAVAAGFDSQLGIALYVGSIEDEKDGWDNERFTTWREGLKARFGSFSTALYTKINVLMGEYSHLK